MSTGILAELQSIAAGPEGALNAAGPRTGGKGDTPSR